jgi:hypothetical protein
VLLAQFHQGSIDGDAGQPRRKPGIAIEALEMNEGLLKRLLDYVFRILVVPHHLPCYAKDRVCGLFAKDLERSRIPTFCSGKKRIFLSRKRASPG